MIRIKQILCLFPLDYIGLGSYAQTASKPIVIVDLIDQVTTFSPSLAADPAVVDIRAAQLKEIATNALPDLKVNYQADFGSNNNVAGPCMAFGG